MGWDGFVCCLTLVVGARMCDRWTFGMLREIEVGSAKKVVSLGSGRDSGWARRNSGERSENGLSKVDVIIAKLSSWLILSNSERLWANLSNFYQLWATLRETEQLWATRSKKKLKKSENELANSRWLPITVDIRHTPSHLTHRQT